MNRAQFPRLPFLHTDVLLTGVALLVVVAFFAAPQPLMEKLHYALMGVCAQRPDHSLSLGGTQLPLEARMGGIFAGMALGIAYLLLLGRARAGLLPSAPVSWTLVGFITAMAVDGLNATLYDLSRAWVDTDAPALRPLYSPALGLRLATGLLAGYGFINLAWPVAAYAVWKDWRRLRSLESHAELLGGLLPLALFYLAATSGSATLLYPVSLFLIASVLAAFTFANFYVLVLLTGRVRASRSWRDARHLLSSSLLLAMLELWALAVLRLWIESETGLRWSV